MNIITFGRTKHVYNLANKTIVNTKSDHVPSTPWNNSIKH